MNAPETDELEDSGYLSPAQFQRLHPETYQSLDALRWALRFRKTNGLLDSGAVAEVYPNKESVRPRVMIHPPRWWRWVRAGGRAAA